MMKGLKLPGKSIEFKWPVTHKPKIFPTEAGACPLQLKQSRKIVATAFIRRAMLPSRARKF
ncbi:hypothetical protein BGI37_02860 [Snodgrassella alvi]|nr:hypothetical protein BGI37_02860 [Snodgrassella alvi]